MELTERVTRTIRRHQMLSPGDTVVVGVSGGADSLGLLEVLAGLQREWSLTLHVAHLNHGLRADAADDAVFVRAASERLRVPCTIESIDVRAAAAREKRSLEDAGRRARYAFFARLAADLRAARVATAHTRDDQVETVLMRLAQGGPWEMLAGIPPMRVLDGAAVVRPLREVPRADITAFLQARGVAWREDPTNRDLRMPRNRVRHQVLPALRSAHPGIDDVLWELGEMARDTDHVINRLAAVLYGHLLIRGASTIHFTREAFRSLPVALQQHLLRMAIAEVSGTPRAPRRVLLEQARHAAAGRPGTETRVGDAALRVGYEDLEIVPAPPAPAADAYRLTVPGEIRAEVFGLTVTADVEDGRLYGEAPDAQEAHFDADCVRGPLLIRSRRPGDRFSPAGLRGKKKVQDFFVDAKIPRWARARIPLVVDAQERILWVVGHRRSDECAPNEHTRRVLRLRVRSA